MPGFRASPALVDGAAHRRCRAIVILPARNEEFTLLTALDALAAQVDELGAPLPSECFEILLLLNNCTDNSAGVARSWQAQHPRAPLHIIEKTLPPKAAHVGTARRLLMDTAWRRLEQSFERPAGILSTDADTIVAPDWITQILCALARGADAVGGSIRLKDGDLKSLPAGARRAYLRDRRYQRLVAELEYWLDPQPCDPWPRHLEHFGASLACTPEIYSRAGGMPPVKPLEDVAFVDALRRVGARLRHEPSVVVHTSGRLDGRAEVGLSGQLRIWQQMSDAQLEHRVFSAAWLAHRFRTLRLLRELCAQRKLPSLVNYPQTWRERLKKVHRQHLPAARFLGELDCDRLIEETFRGEREGPIVHVNRNLAHALTRCRVRAGS